MIRASHFYAFVVAMFLSGTALADDYLCQVDEAQDFNERKSLSHREVVIPKHNNTSDKPILYQKGEFKMTASHYVSMNDLDGGGDFGIDWEQKPFGYRSGTFEPWGVARRQFFIDDSENKVQVDVDCSFRP